VSQGSLLKSNKKFTKMEGEIKEAGQRTPEPRNPPMYMLDTHPPSGVDAGVGIRGISQSSQFEGSCRCGPATGIPFSISLSIFRWTLGASYCIVDTIMAPLPYRVIAW